MSAEILAIGTELTTGAKLDTNSQWLSQQLAAIGISVGFHTTVADDRHANLRVLREAVDRADLVLIGGGLGPTLDDLTREILAELLGVELVLHEPSLETIRGMFARRNRPMPERNVIQAMFPAGSEPLPNPRGTAPGIFASIPRPGRTPCRVAAMPGVPSELKPMFFEQVVPRIGDLAGMQVMKSGRVQCFGLGESACEALLGDVTARNRDPEVGITAHEATITLRIEAAGTSIAECDEKIASTRQLILERLGDYAYGEGDDELEDVVVRLLRERGLTLATFESSSAGAILGQICRVAGGSDVSRGSVTATSDDVRQRLLQITPENRASREAASSLARRMRQLTGADYALATTDIVVLDSQESIAGPPVTYAALATEGRTLATQINLSGDPAIRHSRLVKACLDLLRRDLLGITPVLE